MATTPISVDPETVPLIGLSEVNVGKEPKFDMVLIHSIGGDSRTTWTTVGTNKERIYDTFGKPTGWELKQVVEYWPSHKYFQFSGDARALVFGYDSNFTSFVETNDESSSFLKCARVLVDQLLILRRKDPLRPLVFVGAGLGGYLVKECLRLCRMGDDVALQDIACATRSIVFICCPQVDGKNTNLSEGVARVLHADGVADSQAIADNFRANLDTIHELHSDFLSFLEERAPMLEIYTIQEASRQWVESSYVTEPTILEDDMLDLKYRHEKFETALGRYNSISKEPLYDNMSIRLSCWGLRGTAICVEVRNFPPSTQHHQLGYENKEVGELMQLLNAPIDASAWIGLVGPAGSGKTHVALEASDRIVKGPNSLERSVFWVDASNPFTLEADFQRLSFGIGLRNTTSDDVQCIVMDFLKSRYSGNWVLVFDNVLEKSVFLDFVRPVNALRHTPDQRRLIDIIPSKLCCNVLFLAREASCLEAIFGVNNGSILHLAPPTAAGIARMIDEVEHQEQGAGDTKRVLSSRERKLAEMFGQNPDCLLQVTKQLLRKPEMLVALERHTDAAYLDTNLPTLPTRLATERIREASDECLQLLASLAVLDSRRIPSWLAAQLTAKDDAQSLGELHKYALVDHWNSNDNQNDESSYIRVHSSVLIVIKTALTKSDWEAHMRRTFLTLCHAFMQLWEFSERVDDFLKAAKAFSVEFDRIIPMATKNLDTVQQKIDLAEFVTAELDDFLLHFGGGFRGTQLRQKVEHVLREFASGELHRMRKVLKYASSYRRGPGSRSGGSRPTWWYVDSTSKSSSFKVKRLKFTYD